MFERCHTDVPWETETRAKVGRTMKEGAGGEGKGREDNGGYKSCEGEANPP